MTGDVRKLLGGYATGTLTAEEQTLLFEAALADQELFNALGDEQVLRDYLEDRVFRGELLEALEPAERLTIDTLAFTQLMARRAAASPPPVQVIAAKKPHRMQEAGWIFAGAVAALTLFVFSITLHPSREKVAAFKPPPLPPRKPAPVVTMPMDPPPSLVRQPSPDAALAVIAKLKRKVEPPGRRMTVAVLDFRSAGKKPELGQSVSNLVSNQLSADKVYSVVDRGAVEKAARGSAPLDSANAARIGRKLGADAVVLGEVNEPAPAPPLAAPSSFAAGPGVSATLIDSQTGKRLRDVRVAGVQPDLKVSARAIGTALEAEGKVTDVNAAILTISLGAKAGVKQGDRLTISRGGKTLGSLIVTTASDGFSVGRYTGAEVKIGDRAAYQ